MSGVLRSVGKVFRTVVKVAAVALVAAAVIYTGGAALGFVLPGMGAAMTGVAALSAFPTAVGSLLAAADIAATSTLGGILGGALVFGAAGGATGALMAAVTGKSILKGLTSGAVVGAVTGGVVGGFGGYAVPQANALASQPTAAADIAKGVPDTGFPAGSNPGGGVSPPPLADPNAANAAADLSGAPGASATPGLLPSNIQPAAPMSEMDKFAAMGKAMQPPAPSPLQTLAPVIGGAVGGVGAGIGGYAQGQASLAGQQQAIANTAANYSGMAPGLMTTTPSPPPASTGLPSAVSRFATNFKYEFDPGQGKVVQVPV